MNIKKITEIRNYRNLSNQTLSFDPISNFIIGENNIGKTNTLELIYTLFSSCKFKEDDFLDPTEQIKVTFTLSYSDDEIGFFEDNFDIENNNEITITAIQETIDEHISYFHATPNLTIISNSTIKKINVLYYYAQRMPSKEVDFRRKSGSGKVLNYLIQQSITKNSLSSADIIHEEKITEITKNINEQINCINTVTGDSISSYYDIDTEKILSRVLGLGDENGRDINQLGEGIQYAFNILLQIIENIYSVKASRKPEAFENRLLTVNGEKLYPLFLILDEPEIHQHPYRQRSLIKKIQSIMQNEIPEFKQLLQNILGIDGLTGQLFIVTHSPNILSNDYKQFIRVFKTDGCLNILSGNELSLESTKIYKHMLHNFIYLKEAMFSKGIIFVEGDTENGAIPVLAERMGYDLDCLGIGVVKLDGADGVEKCMELYSLFGIKTVAILDKDKEPTYSGKENIYFTFGIDFEEEIYNSFNLKDYLISCRELEQLNTFIKIFKENNLEINPRTFKDDINTLDLDTNLSLKIMNDNKEDQLKKLRESKNAAKGIILAQNVTFIPKSYEKVIQIISEEA